MAVVEEKMNNEEEINILIDIDENNNNENDNNTKENNNNNNNNIKNNTNDNTKKIILPKEFENFLDIVKEYNQILNKSQNKDFIQKAIKKALKEEIISLSEKVALNFANETIEKLEKKEYFKINKIENNIALFSDKDLEEIIDLLDYKTISLNKEKLKREIVLAPNSIYNYYKEIFKDKKEILDIIKNIEKKNDFFIEDFFNL